MPSEWDTLFFARCPGEVAATVRRGAAVKQWWGHQESGSRRGDRYDEARMLRWAGDCGKGILLVNEMAANGAQIEARVVWTAWCGRQARCGRRAVRYGRLLAVVVEWGSAVERWSSSGAVRRVVGFWSPMGGPSGLRGVSLSMKSVPRFVSLD